MSKDIMMDLQEEALVPEEEWPYEVPQGWKWVRLGYIFNINMGQSPEGQFTSEEPTGLPLIGGPADMGDEYPITKRYTSAPTKKAKPNDLIVSIRATLGKTNIADKEYCIGRGVAAISSNEINIKLIKYYLPLVTKYLYEIGTGTTFAQVSKNDLENLQIPLPPFFKQTQIIDRIESLLGKINEAKKLIEDVPEFLKQFRQAVLAAACSGKLTEGWRESKNLDWEHTTLEKVIKNKPKNGFSPQPVNYQTRVKNITLSATTSGKFQKQYYKYIDKDIEENSYLWLKSGDILIQRGNTLEYVGIAAIYEGTPNEFIYPDLMMKVQANDKIISKYLYYVLLTEKTRNYFRNNATGTAGNMPKINQRVVMDTQISLPPLFEQQEIVNRVETLLKLADQIEEQYEAAQEQLDKLPQVILAKAFRGEL